MMRGCLAFVRRTLSIVAILTFGMCPSVQTVLAEDFDWRNVNGQNWLSPVQDQGNWGVCWAYAACGALESKYMLTRNDNSYRPNVSEQQLVWEGQPDLGSGAGGGKACDSLDYFTSHGVVLESEIPKKGGGTDTYVSGDPWLTTGWQNRVFRSTSNNNLLAQDTSTGYIKSCLKAYGPLTLRCEVDNDWYDPAPAPKRGNHAVVIVGFHDDAAVPGGGYWIIRNSWGAGWNGDGYGKIAYATRPTYEDDDIFHLWISNVNACGITGQAYFTGSMATVAWNGGPSGTWSSGGSTWSGSDMYGNSLPVYAWENKETTANFNTAGGNVNLNGTVIAHGVAINAGATGYTFSGGALTITAGGLGVHETITINSPISIGAPQTWTIDSGKYLTTGDLHTIISNLTINANGNMYVRGSIDGGGAANSAGMAPGTITFNGTGSLNFINSVIVASNIVTNSSNGFYISAGTDHPTYWTGQISGGGAGTIRKTNSGLVVFYANNTYTGPTAILGGALEADSGAGLPTASFLYLDGGVLQSHGAVTFSRSLGTSGPGKFEWTAAGGGFSAGSNPMTVNIGGSKATLTWGTTVGTNIVGTLKFGSLSSQNAVTFQNPINLNGAERIIYVADNPNSSDDCAVISGDLTGGNFDPGDGSGTHYGGINKTGPGRLILTGTGNSYGDFYGDKGRTIISEGVLQAPSESFIPGDSCLQLDGGVFQSSGDFTRGWYDALYNYNVTWNNGGFAANSGKLTVNFFNDNRTISWTGNGHNGIAGTMILNSTSADSEVEMANKFDLNGGARTIQVDDNPNSNDDCASISGVISDSVGTGAIAKTGSGTLYLKAANTFSGNITVSGGTLAGTTPNSFGPSSANRTITVNGGGALNFAASDMFGGHTTTDVPTINIAGGTVTNSNGAHTEFNTLILNGGTLRATSNAGMPGNGGWGTWNFNGTVISYGGSAMNSSDPNATITLQSGDVGNPNTTFDVVNGVLLENIPIYDGIDGHTDGGGNWNLHATGLTKTDAGELWLIADNHYSGATTINGGVLETDRLAANGSVSGIGTGTSLVLNGGTFKYVGGSNNTFNRSITLGVGGGTINQSGSGFLFSLGVISGSGSLTKTGSAQLILQANSSYTGQTNVNAGNLQIRHVNALGSAVGKTVVANGAFLSAGGGMTGTINEPIVLNGSPDGSSSGALQAIDPGTSVTFAGAITLATTSGIGGGVLAQDFNISGNISGSGGLIKYGANRVNLNNTGTFTGDTRLVAGTLGIYGLSLQNSTLDLSNASDTGVLGFGGGFTLGGLKGRRNLSLAGNSVPVTVGNNNQSTSYSGVLSNTALKKIGTGTLILSGANTYTGLTTVAAGTLRLGKAAFEAVLNTTGTGRGADIQGGQLVFDYTGGADPVDTVRANLRASYVAGGGVMVSGPMFSSTAGSLGYGIGYADDAVGKTVIAKIALFGDSDMGGVVNFDDVGVVLGNYNQSGKHWADGDFNYDGSVTFDDLGLVLGNYNQTLPGQFSVSDAGLDAQAIALLSSDGIRVVPEPGTLALLAAGLIGLLAYAWRKRK